MVRLPLLINKQRIKTLEELRENFNLMELIERYRGGQLRAWLNCWDFSSEQEQLETITSDLPEMRLAETLCHIFHVEENARERALTVYKEMRDKQEQERQREELRKAELKQAEWWKQIQKIIHEILAVSEFRITENAKFEDNLMASEWELRDVFMAFEKAFDIKIPADDAQKLKTVGEAFEYIKQKMYSNAKKCFDVIQGKD